MRTHSIFVLASLGFLALLSGCSPAIDPYAATCQKIAENLSGIQNASWEPAEKTAIRGEHLQVKLFSPQTNATCFYQYNESEEMISQDYAHTEYVMSPYKVHIHGVKVSDSDLIKAATAVHGNDAQKAIIDAANTAKTMASESTGKMMDAAKE